MLWMYGRRRTCTWILCWSWNQTLVGMVKGQLCLQHTQSQTTIDNVADRHERWLHPPVYKPQITNNSCSHRILHRRIWYSSYCPYATLFRPQIFVIHKPRSQPSTGSLKVELYRLWKTTRVRYIGLLDLMLEVLRVLSYQGRQGELAVEQNVRIQVVVRCRIVGQLVFVLGLSMYILSF